MTNDPNAFYEHDGLDDPHVHGGPVRPGDSSPSAEDDGSLFEVRTVDTETFQIVARTTTGAPVPSQRRAAPPVSASPTIDLRAHARASSAAGVPRTGARRPPIERAAQPPGTRARRRHSGTPRVVSVWLSTLRAMLVMGLAAVLVSTIFSLWTRPSFFTDEFRAGLNQVQATQHVINIQPAPLPTDIHQVRIGIIIGHSGPPQDASFVEDPGAVCPDGLKELEINTAVAQRVIAKLSSAGYTVDLLAEFDPRLENYLADALLSIHTNDCQDYGEAGTGYSVAAASARQTTRGADEFLRDCMINQYGQTTGLPHHGEITYDMSGYHNFDEVSADTPTAIIELGFMYRDRAILTGNPDLIAQGIVNGFQCFFGANTLAGY